MGLSESLQRAIDHFGGHDDHDEYDDYREYGHEDETGVACEHVRLRHEQRSERRRRHAGRGSAAGGLYDQGSADGGISSGESFARPLALVRPEPTEFGSFTPHSFGEAQQIADRFLSGVPVFVEVGSCDAVLAGRVLDFCSGLICAGEGRLQSIGERAYLLTPACVELSGEEGASASGPGNLSRR